MASRKEVVGALGALLRRIQVTESLDALVHGSVVDNALRVFNSAVKGNPAPLPWKPLRQVAHARVGPKEIAAVVNGQGIPEAVAREMFERIEAEETLWINDTYQVSRRDTGGGSVHLSIKRIDQEPVHDWRDLQRIKNELIGPDCEAIELYPAEDRRVDTANQYHLWGLADPDYRFPVGFSERKTSTGSASYHQRDEEGL